MSHVGPMKWLLPFLYFIEDIESAGVLVIFYYLFDHICSVKPGESSYGLCIVKWVSSSRWCLYRFSRKFYLHRMFSLSQGVLVKYSSWMLNYIRVASGRNKQCVCIFFLEEQSVRSSSTSAQVLLSFLSITLNWK